MIVIVDGDDPKEVLNTVKVIVGDGDEIHVAVTLDGIIVDRVVRDASGNGTVMRSSSWDYEVLCQED